MRKNRYLAWFKRDKRMKLRITIILCFLGIIVAFELPAQSLKSDTLDVLDYDISLDLRHLSLQQLIASTEITAVPRMASVSSFSLDFRKLSIDSLILNGQPYSAYSYDDTVLRVMLANPISFTDTFTLRVVYHGIPLIEPYNWGGFHFLPDSTLAFNLGVAFEDYPHNYGRVWFPCLDDFIDRATYHLHVRTKATHKAVGGGMPAGTTSHPDGSITWHWNLDQAIPTYLASVAVGEFSVLQGEYHGIQDTIPSMIYVRQQDSAKAVVSFSNLNAMMGIFESRYGAYRWPRIGYTGTTKGAMEHATNIAIPRTLITGNLSYDWLIAHELSHHWFGDLITCASAEDMWINEGWARFSEAVYTEGMQGWEAYKGNIMDLQKQVLNFAHTTNGDGAFYPLYPVPQTHTYGTTVYDKGALVAHSLRGYLGDTLFFLSVKAMLNHFAFKPASSYQIRDFLSQYAGGPLGPFFDGWVFTPGFPHFSIDSVQSVPSGGGWNVTVFARQKMMGRSVYTQFNRVEIGFYADRHTRNIELMTFNGATGQQTFFLPFDPVLVLMDPEDRLADAITAHTATISTTGTHQFSHEFFKLRVNSITDTLLIRIEHSFVPPDSLPQPVAGLTLSPNRYWKISGIIPPSTNLDGQFTFSTGNYFDNALINNTVDSLIILYRKDAGEAWGSIPFTRTPGTYSGTITVPGLLNGEYVLAKWDHAHIGIASSIKPTEPEVLIYPNPAGTKITLQTSDKRVQNMVISSISGAVLDQWRLQFHNGNCETDISHIAPGTYLVELTDKQGTIVSTEKITVVR